MNTISVGKPVLIPPVRTHVTLGNGFDPAPPVGYDNFIVPNTPSTKTSIYYSVADGGRPKDREVGGSVVKSHSFLLTSPKRLLFLILKPDVNNSTFLDMFDLRPVTKIMFLEFSVTHFYVLNPHIVFCVSKT